MKKIRPLTKRECETPLTPAELREATRRYQAMLQREDARLASMQRQPPPPPADAETVARVRAEAQTLLDDHKADIWIRDADKRALARLDGELRRLAPSNDALRAALLNTLADKSEAIRKATPDPKTLTPRGREWLALRVTPKGETVKEGRTRWPSQRDIAAALRVGKNIVCRMETELEARSDVRAFLAVLRVPLRTPRGNRQPTGTNRKNVRRA